MLPRLPRLARASRNRFHFRLTGKGWDEGRVFRRPPAADGTQRALVQLTSGLGARGHCQSVVCLNDSWDPLVLNRLKSVGVDVYIVGKPALLAGYGLGQALRWLRQGQFDVVVTFLLVSDIIGRWLAHRAGVPSIVSSLRARNVDYTRWQRYMVRHTMRWADAVVVNSSALREYSVRMEGAKPETVRVIMNGVDVDDLAVNECDLGALRSELGIPTGVLVVGSIGRLTSQKGYDLLLSAMGLIPGQNFHLVLVGAGEEEARLKGQADSLGLASRVHITGYRRDVPAMLHFLDLYVQPSRYEGMPNALLEAMAAARPIVASAVDGNCDLIEVGLSGWLVPPNDPEALAGALTYALANPGEAQRFGEAAAERVARDFTVNAMVTKYDSLYRELVSAQLAGGQDVMFSQRAEFEAPDRRFVGHRDILTRAWPDTVLLHRS